MHAYAQRVKDLQRIAVRKVAIFACVAEANPVVNLVLPYLLGLLDVWQQPGVSLASQRLLWHLQASAVTCGAMCIFCRYLSQSAGSMW